MYEKVYDFFSDKWAIIEPDEFGLNKRVKMWMDTVWEAAEVCDALNLLEKERDNQ